MYPLYGERKTVPTLNGYMCHNCPPPRLFLDVYSRKLNALNMYDLDIQPLFQCQESDVTITSIVQKENVVEYGDDVCVLVGDNITIQEHPKKVRFTLPEEDTSGEDVAVGQIPVVERPWLAVLPRATHKTIDVDVSAQCMSNIQTMSNLSTSLFSVDETFGTSYVDAPCETSHVISRTSADEIHDMPWKTKCTLKACFALFLSLPFIMVATIQPWNSG